MSINWTFEDFSQDWLTGSFALMGVGCLLFGTNRLDSDTPSERVARVLLTGLSGAILVRVAKDIIHQ